jgi:hypothetical protein
MGAFQRVKSPGAEAVLLGRSIPTRRFALNEAPGTRRRGVTKTTTEILDFVQNEDSEGQDAGEQRG